MPLNCIKNKRRELEIKMTLYMSYPSQDTVDALSTAMWKTWAE